VTAGKRIRWLPRCTKDANIVVTATQPDSRQVIIYWREGENMRVVTWAGKLVRTYPGKHLDLVLAVKAAKKLQRKIRRGVVHYSF